MKHEQLKKCKLNKPQANQIFKNPLACDETYTYKLNYFLNFKEITKLYII